ncbi:SDR family oxidoreductase [Streptomyces sp. NPDC057617]|uniref:SDR family oxidoreductase n=1 Tax=Streptomyces sp. NPDC057617 TaxID=3346184 RepID=UPI0036979067
MEVAPRGVRVNALRPGLIETPMIATMDPATEPMKSLLAAHPVGRIAQAHEIADAAVRLCSETTPQQIGVPDNPRPVGVCKGAHAGAHALARIRRPPPRPPLKEHP